MLEELDKLKDNIKNHYNIDLDKYKNTKVFMKIGELIVFPEYAVKSILKGVFIGFLCFICSLLFLEFSFLTGVIYFFVGSSLWFCTGFILGINILFLKLKTDLINILSFGFDLTQTINDDILMNGRMLNKNEIIEIFKGVNSVVLMPTLSEAISARVPFIGNLVNNIVQKILKQTIKKVDFDSSNDNIKVFSNEINPKIVLQKAKNRSINFLQKTIKTIQFPFQILGIIIFILTLSLLLFI